MDHANKANVDAQKNMKRYQDGIRELQQQIEDEQRIREEVRDQLATAERRAQMLQTEKEDLAVNFEQVNFNKHTRKIRFYQNFYF